MHVLLGVRPSADVITELSLNFSGTPAVVPACLDNHLTYRKYSIILLQINNIIQYSIYPLGLVSLLFCSLRAYVARRVYSDPRERC